VSEYLGDVGLIVRDHRLMRLDIRPRTFCILQIMALPGMSSVIRYLHLPQMKVRYEFQSSERRAHGPGSNALVTFQLAFMICGNIEIYFIHTLYIVYFHSIYRGKNEKTTVVTSCLGQL
jgi:hypothetical protein